MYLCTTNLRACIYVATVTAGCLLKLVVWFAMNISLRYVLVSSTYQLSVSYAKKQHVLVSHVFWP